MFMKRITRPFRRLQGKLTLSYALITVVTLLLFEMVFISTALWISSLNIPNFALNILKQEAPQAPPYFVHGTADRAALTAWLRIVNDTLPDKQGPFHFPHPVLLMVTDAQGQTITSISMPTVSSASELPEQLSSQEQGNLYAVLRDTEGTTNKTASEADGTLVLMTPIVGRDGKIDGALVMKIVPPDTISLMFEFFTFTALTVVVLTTVASVIGTISGYLTARGITQRLKNLSLAADRWSHGDFTSAAPDTSEDELGQTTRQLNRMAEQLHNLLQARQKLATLEERNRLARDLHDSVKQQIFAVSMQIAATRVLLRRDTDAAEMRLHEAEKLVKQAQQELTTLIRELRPVVLEGKGLASALRELATRCAQQTECVANVCVEGAQTLSLTVEEALYRIAQEALSNVARHSQATLVQMTLTMAGTSDTSAENNETVTLSIVDNGQGFALTQQTSLGVGLLSMQERMKALGGDVQIESAPGKGTRIIAHCKRLGSNTSATTIGAAQEPVAASPASANGQTLNAK